MRMTINGYLAVLALLCTGGIATADPPEAADDKLVEGSTPESFTRRLACGTRFCVWYVAKSLGPCAGGDCTWHELAIGDRADRELTATKTAPYPSARFISDREVEIITAGSLIAGEEPWAAGVSPVLMSRRLLTLSPKGTKIVSDKAACVSPERCEKLKQLLGSPETPAEKAQPITAAMVAKARAACDAQDKLEILHQECRKGSCVFVLGGKPQDEEPELPPLCFVELKGQEVRLLPVDQLVDGADTFSLSGNRYCFLYSHGGRYGSQGEEQCISRDRPGRMAFIETAGLQLESGEGYPVRKADSIQAGRAIAPTVHAVTVVEVSWGRNAWRDEKDLSLKWQAMRIGDTLRLHVEVNDDVLMPLEKETVKALHTDHLELSFSGPATYLPETKRPYFKLGVLLAEDGKVQCRLWERRKDGKRVPVDEKCSASGTWARAKGGYVVDLSLPFELLRKELGNQLPFQFTPLASDTDEKGRQETLLGSREGSLRFWDEYPPTIEEYARVMGASP